MKLYDKKEFKPLFSQVALPIGENVALEPTPMGSPINLKLPKPKFLKWLGCLVFNLIDACNEPLKFIQ